MLPRFHVAPPTLLQIGTTCALPESTSRHVQVLRMQPGGQVQLFDGLGAEYLARIVEMGRKVVTVELEALVEVNRELPVKVVLAVGMPANDRMDALVEKAAELGVYAIQPLICERAVLRLDGDRAAKKVAHWQAVAVSASEQCGRAVVPEVREVMTLPQWLRHQQAAGDAGNWRKGVLSLREAVTLRQWLAASGSIIEEATSSAALGGSGGSARPAGSNAGFMFLSGPEGGLSLIEEQAALDAGWAAITLGARVLRADTAPLAALSIIGSVFEPAPER